MILAMARDQFPGVEPDVPGKHRMPAGESSSGAPNKKRAKISVEPTRGTSGPTRNDFLSGRGSRSDYRPPGFVHWQESSHSDEWKKSSQPLPLDGLPKGILKKGNHGKSDETLKDNPMADFKDIQEPLNDKLGDLDAANSILDLSGSNPRLSFLSNEDRTSSGIVADKDEPRRSSLASLGSWNARLSDTSIASIDSKMLDGRDSEVSVDARDLDDKDTNVDDIDYLVLLRLQMYQAASSEDFVRAGELQQEVRHWQTGLRPLQPRMTSYSRGNYRPITELLRGQRPRENSSLRLSPRHPTSPQPRKSEKKGWRFAQIIESRFVVSRRAFFR